MRATTVVKARKKTTACLVVNLSHGWPERASPC